MRFQFRSHAASALAGAVALICALGAPSARASFHLFRISEVYSDPSGEIQYIEITESTGSNFENFWNGVSISSSSKQFTFTSNLPSDQTANRSVLLGTQAFAQLAGAPAPDFVIPDNFFSPSGDSLNYGFVDLVNFGAMPVNPLQSLQRSGAGFTPGINSPRNFSGQTGAVPEPAGGLMLIGGLGLLNRRR